jgi:Zn-dependent protease
MRLSFLVLLGLVAVTGSGLGAVGLVLLTFGSVVLHELGHALVAQQRGVRIAAIDLHFLGGAAIMVDPPRSARDEIAIALAGPAVSFALAFAGLVLGSLTGIGIVQHLGWVNLALGAFNLLPALPMDGGRVLRAALSRRLGYGRATEAAVSVSRVLSVGLGLAGLASGSLSLVLIAFLVWSLGTAERRAAWTTGYGDRLDLDKWIAPLPALRPTRVITYRL